jgi:hypothetical protein
MGLDVTTGRRRMDPSNQWGGTALTARPRRRRMNLRRDLRLTLQSPARVSFRCLTKEAYLFLPPTDEQKDRAAQAIAHMSRAGLGGGTVGFFGEDLTRPCWWSPYEGLTAPAHAYLQVRVPIAELLPDPSDEEELIRACEQEIHDALWEYRESQFGWMVEQYFRGERQSAQKLLPWIDDSVLRKDWEQRLATVGAPTENGKEDH